MIDRIDHLVLTVRSLEATCSFYERALGFTRVDAAGKPTALHFGGCKLSVHEAERTFEPKASTPVPGSADFCLIAECDLGEIIHHLSSQHVEVELGPVERHGAHGAMMSVYFRDPDGNLVEVSRYAPTSL